MLRAVEVQLMWLYLVFIFISHTTASRDIMSISLKAEINAPGKRITYNIEPIPGSYAKLGEGPHWDIATQSLYYVDILLGKLLRYDYNQDQVYTCKVENEDYVSYIIPVANITNQFVVGIKHKVAIVSWDGISDECKIEKILYEVEREDDYRDNVFNDGKCDPHGRLYAGTMFYTQDLLSHRKGHLFRFGKEPTVIKSDIGISNGLAWNLKAKKFYYIDTADFEVKEYDYNAETGVVNNPKVVFDFRNKFDSKTLLPDGMTIDVEGNLYVATFNGSMVYKIDPRSGVSEFQIKLPTEQITSVAFGGPNLDILFVTTSSKDDKPPPAGTMYKVTGLNIKGLPMSRMTI